MVNRVNGNNYYDYSKLKMPNAADKTKNGEKFSLNYQRAQEEKEDEDKKEQVEEGKDGKAAGGRPRIVMQSGVKLELSGSGQALSDSKKDGSAQAEQAGAGFIDTVRSWIAVFTQTLKDILYKIWNDSAPQGDMAENAENVEQADTESDQTEEAGDMETSAESEAILQTDESERNKEIRKYLRSGNLEQVINLITDNGHKTMAKNSTLLTYYDRTGRITPLSPSDQERILHGDRNVTEL